MIKSRLMPISSMRMLDKKNENFSMKLCKFFTNGLVCLNQMRDDYCTYTHDEFCKNIIEESKTRKMNDDAIRVYMES